MSESISVRLYEPIDREAVMRKLEAAGRISHMSEGDGSLEAAAEFVNNIVDMSHESVLEHVSLSVRVTCTRACSAQIGRHRHTSITAKSFRYVKFVPGSFHYYMPPEFPDSVKTKFVVAQAAAEEAYLAAIEAGATPQRARYALPMGSLTEMVLTANLRVWRHMIRLRTSWAADQEIRELFLEIRDLFRAELPEIFGKGE